jgi:hypothetical protein
MCTAIFSSIDYVTKVFSVTSDVPAEVNAEVGTEVVLSEKDAVLLSKSARYLEIRDHEVAVRLMTLASLASPSLLWPKAKLKGYRSAKGKQSNAQYMLTFHTNKVISTPEEKEIWDRFGEWLVLQDFVGGNFLVELNGTRNINTEGVVAECNKSGFHGYTILQAESIDATLFLARKCPVLELGASIRLSELNFALCKQES